MSKKIQALFAILSLSCLLPAYALGTGKDDEINTEGVVVAVQLDPGAGRSEMEVNAESMGDFAEVWMVRLTRPVSPNGSKYILVEDTHVNRHESFVMDSQLNTTAWKFSLRLVSEDRRGTCLDWGERYVATAFGRHEKLPTPKTLACFQIKARPVPTGQ